MHGYNETISEFFLRLLALALTESSPKLDFLDFLRRYPFLNEFGTIFDYYSKERLYSDDAIQKFVDPDIKPFPITLEQLKRDIE